MQRDNPLSLPTDITFTTEKKEQQLVLINPTESAFVFKIKSTDRDSLELKIFEGCVEAGSTRNISILLKKINPDREKKIKLLVQWAAADSQSKDKRIEAFQKAEVRSFQIIIYEVEVEPQPINIPLNTTEPQPVLQQRISIPLETIEAPPSNIYDQKLESQKLRHAQLNKTAETLRKEYSEVMEASKLKNSNVKSNAAVVIIIMLIVFFIVSIIGSVADEF